MSQEELGEVLGVTRKTIGRWQHHAIALSPSETRRLVEAVHPVDSALASELAAAGETTLEALGFAAPKAARVEAPRPPPPPRPALPHLVDAVVLAAAEAYGELSPRLRPVLRAAFERADAMGISVREVIEGLDGIAAKDGKRRA